MLPFNKILQQDTTPLLYSELISVSQRCWVISQHCWSHQHHGNRAANRAAPKCLTQLLKMWTISINRRINYKRQIYCEVCGDLWLFSPAIRYTKSELCWGCARKTQLQNPNSIKWLTHGVIPEIQSCGYVRMHAGCFYHLLGLSLIFTCVPVFINQYLTF